MKVLITGGKGYLGSVLTRMLNSEGIEHLIIDPNLFGAEGPNLGHQNWFQTALIDLHGLDAVVHLAANVGEPACQAFPRFTEWTNGAPARRFLRHISQEVPVILASTCSVYGAADHVLFEDSATNPLGPYAETRLRSEVAVLGSVMDGRTISDPIPPTPGTVLRFGTLFGPSPRQRFDLVINHWAREIMAGREVVVNGGNQWRPFTHVNDAARAILICLKRLREEQRELIAGQVFNVAGMNSTLLEVANGLRNVGEQAGVQVKIRVDEAQTDPRNYRVNSQKIDVLGWKAIDSNLESVANWWENWPASGYHHDQDRFHNDRLLKRVDCDEAGRTIDIEKALKLTG